jgi:hypothetical protein
LRKFNISIRIITFGVIVALSLTELIRSIENLREQLNLLALNRTLVDPDVVDLSQRLDALLNIYNSM